MTKQFKIFNLKFKILAQRGMTLFIAVTIMAIILFITFAVTNIAVKSTQFASSGKDSQMAFFAADAGVECALYWDTKTTTSSFDPVLSVGTPITCGGKVMATGQPIPNVASPATSTTTLIGGGVGTTQSITLVNTASGGNNAAGISIASGQFEAASGNLIVVTIRYHRYASNQGISQVRDTAGNVYTQIPGSVIVSSNNYLGIWYKENAVGINGNVVTVTFTHAAIDFRNINVLQYSGIATNSSVDAYENGGPNTNNEIESDSFDTNTADELIVAAAELSNATPPAWSATRDGYTRQVVSPTGILMTADRIVSSLQNNEHAKAYNSSNAVKMMSVATFRAGSTGGGGTPTRTSVFGFNMDGGANPIQTCAIVTVTKNLNDTTHIASRGYNTCDTNNTRRIERGLEVDY